MSRAQMNRKFKETLEAHLQQAADAVTAYETKGDTKSNEYVYFCGSRNALAALYTQLFLSKKGAP